MASVLGPFLAFGGRRAEIAYSDYDDSLALHVQGRADVDLLWLDFERYRDRLAPRELVAWLLERVQSLRARSEAPILVADCAATDAAAQELNDGLRNRLVQALVLAPGSDRLYAGTLGSGIFILERP